MKRPYSICLVIPLIMLTASMSLSDVGQDSTYWIFDGPDQEVSVFVRPDGGGDPLTSCRAEFTPFGQWEDATITVTLINWSQEPFVGLPAEDLWLESSAYGLVTCAGGAIADGPSDANGVMTFSGPLSGGGFSDRDGGEKLEIRCSFVMVNHPGFDIRFNSPDLDGDLYAGLSDVYLFTRMYPSTAGYHYAVDYYFDGVNDLSDLVLFRGALHTSCE